MSELPKFGDLTAEDVMYIEALVDQVTLQELTDKFDCSKRTIQQVYDYLKAQGRFKRQFPSLPRVPVTKIGHCYTAMDGTFLVTVNRVPKYALVPIDEYNALQQEEL